MCVWCVNCQLFYLCSAHRFLSTSDKQREVGQSSCLLCPSLEQQSICDLFCEMVPFLFSNSSTVREGAVADKGWQVTWRWVQMLMQSGLDKRVHPHRHGGFLPAETSNTMMWGESAWELTARYKDRTTHTHKDTDDLVQQHTRKNPGSSEFTGYQMADWAPTSANTNAL